MNIVSLFTGAVIALIGINMFLAARKARKRDMTYAAWPTAQGKVVSAAKVQPLPEAASGVKEGDLCDVTLRYEFRSGGQLRFGSAISAKKVLYPPAEAEKVAQRYPAGQAITVHYNPEDIQDCYLELKPSPEGRYYWLSIGIIVVAVIWVLGALLPLFAGGG